MLGSISEVRIEVLILIKSETTDYTTKSTSFPDNSLYFCRDTPRQPVSIFCCHVIDSIIFLSE